LEGTLGSLALSQGRIEESRRHFASALEIDRRSIDRLSTDRFAAFFHQSQMLLNLGVSALALEHYEDAIASLDQAEALATSIGARLVSMKALGTLGRIYYQTGDFSRSQASTASALQQANALGAVRDTIQLLINAGLSDFALGDSKAARAKLERALVLAEAEQTTELSLSVHVALASLALRERSDRAEAEVQSAVLLASKGEDRSEDLEPMLLEALLRQQQGRDREARTLLLSLIERSGASPSFQWEAEKTLANLYALTKQPGPADHWFQRAILTFHTQRLSLRSLELQLPFLENGASLYGGYVDFLIAQHRPVDALRVLDTSRAETLAEGLGQAPARLAEYTRPQALASRLGATILVYSLRPERSFLWAIDGSRLQLCTLPGSGALLPLIARHNAAILASKDLLGQPDSTGRVLYDALLAPAAAMLPREAHVVLLAGDGLSQLNFDTLIPPGKDPHYWVEDVTVSNARSLRLLTARPAAAPKAARTALLLGDPIYQAAEYPPLPNAGAELARVAGHFPVAARTVLSGPAATPAAYAAASPGSFGYLHVTAHATARETTPLDSAIILSHPSPHVSEKLYAAEILKQPLHAELVTLSSCYGTGTRNYTGEGLVGLVWAFLRAGAHSVVGAQWAVSDAAAPEFMDAFYTRLLAGDPPDAALRAAKLRLIHQGGVFRKPLYWAAFQLYTGR
jgi:CHAT domain-containing protein/tetratricopeptide (TPR) repeat protein